VEVAQERFPRLDCDDHAAVLQAVVALEKRAGLSDDAIAASRIRAAMGGWGKYEIGSRALHIGNSGWDVAGDIVRTRERLGLVGATGDAAGPHLHFEVRVPGAAVDPLSGLK
jgi:hypothetical protein